MTRILLLPLVVLASLTMTGCALPEGFGARDRTAATTALRLITMILQSVMASAENVCRSPTSRPKISPGR